MLVLGLGLGLVLGLEVCDVLELCLHLGRRRAGGHLVGLGLRLGLGIWLGLGIGLVLGLGLGCPPPG